jgi:hypothetical protein
MRMQIIADLQEEGFSLREIGNRMGGVRMSCIHYHISRYGKKTRWQRFLGFFK